VQLRGPTASGIMSPMDHDTASRQSGIDQLIDQVARIVRESGRPESFDPAAWTASWLERPIPALGGRRPIEYMDSEADRAVVYQLIAQMQSGTYA
jgi:uncharacterized protein (DUF2384 family)